MNAVLKIGQERAVIHQEGGISFERFLRGVGWIVCDDHSEEPPSAFLFQAALAVRSSVFPQLEPIGV